MHRQGGKHELRYLRIVAVFFAFWGFLALPLVLLHYCVFYKAPVDLCIKILTVVDGPALMFILGWLFAEHRSNIATIQNGATQE